MSAGQWIAFLGVLAAVLCTPGPDFAVVASQAFISRRAAYATAAGVMCGLCVHTISVAVGLSAVIAASPVMFTALRLIGSCYLIALAAMTLWATYIQQRSPASPTGTQPVPRNPMQSRALWQLFGQGVLTNISNPKALLFFLGLLPQFIDPGQQATLVATTLAVTTVGVAAVWWTVVITAITATPASTADPRTRCAVDTVCACTLLVLGCGFLLSA
ncbi:Lysine exporter protein (LYSE/YGGA) [Mycolicibacterium rhodesiae JS60]|nr:Lysine exporter protein (LYSE/YGGA) [Mycolicibacterium rhodesiae JS60]